MLWHCQSQFVDDVWQDRGEASRELLLDYVDMVRIIDHFTINDVPDL